MIPKAKKILDLSQPIYHACPAWPTYAPVIVDYEARHVTHGFIAERITMNTHTGTHIDAPYHFSESGAKVEEMDLTQFQGRGVPMDMRGIGTMAISDKHLAPYADKICPGDIALICTGWGEKRALTKEYMYEWPYITREAAQWLVDKDVKAVCIDGMSVGGWPEGTGVPSHEVLLGNGIVVVEELYMDDALFAEPEWHIVAFPLKLQGCGGAPVRVAAITYED